MAEKWQKWMPFHIDRWRGSAHVQAMRAAARAGYLYLLTEAWQSSDCSIPDNDEDLQVLSGLTEDEWTEFGPKIRKRFTAVDGRLVNDVLRGEWEGAKRVFSARSLAARTTTATRSPSGQRTVTVQSPERSADTQTKTKTETRTQTETETETRTEQQREVSPSLVAQGVMHEAGIAGRELPHILETVCRAEMAGGRDPTDLRDAMVAAWREYGPGRERMNKPWGAEKFFGEGHWKTPGTWPWKKETAPPPPAAPRPVGLTLLERVAEQKRRSSEPSAEHQTPSSADAGGA